MNRIPDAVAVASLETHRLIVTVPNDGPAEISSNLPGPVAASVLRQIAAHVERPGRCATAVATGRPCPVHDTPAPPRPTGLDDLLATVADQLPQDDPDRAARGLADMTTPADRHPADDEQKRQHPNPSATDPEQPAPPTLADAFANFGTKLRAALEQSAANLAALAEEQADEEEQEQPRRLLAEEEYDAVYRAAVDALGARMRHIGHHMTGDVVDATLAAVGILAPPPEPDGDTCSAMFADPTGTWWQCLDPAGHNPDEGHDAGDWTWPSTTPDAIPPRAAE
ncbi:hypothetical protein [[Kitasatospora] papulosa]|uniref:Uncharacterized protein n=1 Tax=[Kitasatospora] papulosa TaxID=1464011 RepID=A0ABZ1K489_9ACTN